MTKLNKIDLTLITCNVALLQRPLRRLLMLSEKLMHTVYVATTSYLRCGKLFDEGANESHDRLEEALPSTIWTLSTLKPAFPRHLKYSLFSSIKLLGLPDLPPLQQWKRNAVGEEVSILCSRAIDILAPVHACRERWTIVNLWPCS